MRNLPPTIVVVSPLWRPARQYVNWRKAQPDHNPLTVFRIITELHRLRGITGDGNEFVYVHAPVNDHILVVQLQNRLDARLRRADGSKAPYTYVNLDSLSGVLR